MKTQQFQPTRMPVQHPHGRRWWIIGLGIVLFLAALASARYMAPPPERTVTTSQPIAAPVESVDPAAQSVLDYLRAHSVVRPMPLDAATQGVLGYLNAHRTVETKPLDPAQQSVIDYIRAHSR